MAGAVARGGRSRTGTAAHQGHARIRTHTRPCRQSRPCTARLPPPPSPAAQVLTALLVIPFPRNVRKGILLFTHKVLSFTMGARAHGGVSTARLREAARAAARRTARPPRVLSCAHAPSLQPHPPNPPTYLTPPVGGMQLVHFALCASGIPLVGARGSAASVAPAPSPCVPPDPLGRARGAGPRGQGAPR